MISAMRRPAFAALTGSALLALLTTSERAHAADQKFALAVMHFNVQYVAGGMVGFWPNPDPVLDQPQEANEDQIVVESFEPVLDLLLAHPTWATDVEMQGYMLDVIGERHPTVLAKLQQLTANKRLEVMSFHYSDQLFMAHGREDWARSADLTRATFAKWKVPLGSAIFCQEGQAGPGMAAAMKDKGYATLVWPKNLWSYQLGDAATPLPLYSFGAGGESSMVTSREVSWKSASGADSIATSWWFVDDGELMATGGIDPYFPDLFKKKPAAIAKYEKQLADLEAAGYAISTVSAYVEAVRAVVPKTDAPGLLDGTWQPNSTDGIHKWLGGGGIHRDDERDGDVRTLATIAHRELVAAGAIAKKAGLDATPQLDAAWRLLALGEVSDASGINPFRGEIEYGLVHLAEATRIARDVIRAAKAKLGAASVSIDPASGEVSSAPAPLPAPTPIEPPLALVIDASDRPLRSQWTRVGANDVAVTLEFGPGTSPVISVKFPGVLTAGDAAPDLVYTPGLAEAPVHLPRAGFVFDHFHLALSDGLLGLGANRFVVQDQGFVHASARVTKADADAEFLDEVVPLGESVTWTFHVVTGSDADARGVANALNVARKVWR
jgi:hypothetical protein